MDEYSGLTDLQFKHGLRRRRTEISRRIELLKDGEYQKLEDELLRELKDIELTLQD